MPGESPDGDVPLTVEVVPLYMDAGTYAELEWAGECAGGGGCVPETGVDD